MNEYEIAGVVSGSIAAIWILVYILCWVGQWAWAWVDDAKVHKGNLIVGFLAKKYGFVDDGDKELYYHHPVIGGHGEGFIPFVGTLGVTSLIPVCLVVTFNFYPIVLSVLLFFVFAMLARFSRRHKKLFDKHIEDKDAHK